MPVRGHLYEPPASGDLYPDKPERSSVTVTINTASIRTHNEQRDNDLRASNFLEVDKFPTITFKSTKVEPKSADRGTLTGDLTIKAVTKPVTLDVVKYGEFNDPMMGHRIGYAAETKINRKDFGMNFDAMLDGRFVVSNDVSINIEGEIVEAADEQAKAKPEAGAARK